MPSVYEERKNDIQKRKAKLSSEPPTRLVLLSSMQPGTPHFTESEYYSVIGNVFVCLTLKKKEGKLRAPLKVSTKFSVSWGKTQNMSIEQVRIFPPKKNNFQVFPQKVFLV